MVELFKDIVEPGFEGLYVISNTGHVYRKLRSGGMRELNGGQDSKGRRFVSFSNKGICKTFLRHRLVAKYFLKDYSEELTVDHIRGPENGDGVDNLRMCTTQENTWHYWHDPYFEESRQHTKKLISESSKGNTNNLGKKLPHSEETKKKISDALKGKPKSEEHRKKMSETIKGNTYCLGHHHTDQTRKKMSESHKGSIQPEETKKKRSEALKRYWASKEARIKQSERIRESWSSTELRNKQSELLRNHYLLKESNNV